MCWCVAFSKLRPLISSTSSQSGRSAGDPERIRKGRHGSGIGSEKEKKLKDVNMSPIPLIHQKRREVVRM
jgi:hypothetical protein